MAKREIKHPDKTVDTGAYSAGVEIEGWVYVSGQGPLDLRTGEVLHGSIEEETRHTLANVEKILRAADCSLADVVKCTVHLADIRDFDAFNRAYAAYFKDVRPLPARTTVQSTLWDGIKIEIDAVARKRQETP
ncbi:MAG TPA: RidA family protein [Chthonomonadaceae bacterium]|nr:RidA family protein [Chthonomonadaceae bacterium]